MKHFALAVTVVALALGIALQTGTPAQPKSGGVEQELMKLEKAQHIEVVKSHAEEMLSVASDEWKVRVYGEAAVVMARNTVKIQMEGKESTFQTQFTDTWVKRADRWPCVASHLSILPQK